MPLHITTAAEARNVSVVSLNVGLLGHCVCVCEAVKLKYELPWSTQDVRNARVVGYL